MRCNNIIGAYGLNESELTYIRSVLPSKDSDLMDTDCATDRIAVGTFALIIDVAQMSVEDRKMILEFYRAIEVFSETVIVIGNIELLNTVQGKFKCYPDFISLKPNLKYILLSAWRKKQKSENFSTTLANAITILNGIRNKPGVTSAELAKLLELSNRSIQRYIETLRIAGEWIEYDPKSRGWKLSAGKSVLWGDFNEMCDKDTLEKRKCDE